MENKASIPTEVEKLDKKIKEIEDRITEYGRRKEEQLNRRNQKQKSGGTRGR